MRHFRGAVGRCIAGVSASATATAVMLMDEPAHAASSKSVSKIVHELSVNVSDNIAGDFSYWLKSYIKELLQLPGMQGAKLLSPVAPPPKPGVVFVLGGPGAGKGTQSELIVEKCGYTHLSAGDLLRAERKSGSAQGQMIDEYIAEGKIVPVEVTVKLLINAIKASGGQRFLIDGFPRNTNNLSGWQEVAGDSLTVGGVLFYDCPEDVMEARLLERGKTSGRTDDNIESIKKRFRTYTNETTPIIAYYDYQGIVHKIDGTREVEAVWGDTQAAIGSIEARFAAASKPATVRSIVCSTGLSTRSHANLCQPLPNARPMPRCLPSMAVRPPCAGMPPHLQLQRASHEHGVGRRPPRRRGSKALWRRASLGRRPLL